MTRGEYLVGINAMWAVKAATKPAPEDLT